MTSRPAPAPPPASAAASSPAPSGRGLFVVFEGGDGAGKSTQVGLLVDALRAEGHDTLRTREPGGTPLGERVRELVLDPAHGPVDARAEALLFAAARAAHVAQLIRPALAAGRTVVCDRFADSSAAYQGAGRGLGLDRVAELNAWATAGLVPDLTVLLDVPAGTGRTRREARDGTAGDRLETEPDAFHDANRAAFLELAGRAPERYLVLDATRPAGELSAAVRERLTGLARSARAAEVSA
ncbi:dTMP kinase [Kocuria rosea]|uniref:Thymidylate kinase n=2 Tax=Kocuria TaxID=57493 RepID=A0A0A6YCN6_KOCRO|nr:MULTISPECIES: dTMP kinase [Kocuria]KHD97752.1 thymidylate kinase [Kocuria polaris]MCM3487456.1 dTMP kinase [Kocuria rosea]MEB2529008.1 dTMP kinase [Kocuria rosea]WIG16619.1 dTMP kinase [Kocuria rosea]STX04676.1 Thymidylate kinase [Kocuria rosea]